ncbi:MAG: hypothetical protein ISEC1_P0486 [Thiomicrorhabdus sp.]|nr:MAG: hypothetical protein ISEC1_P0486 [Thiomicrorhabdus sp.]
MTNQINQIQATYNTFEDRIRLTIKTHSDQVFVAWLTRRYLGILLPVLHGQHPISGESFFDEKSVLSQQAEQEKSQLDRDMQQPFEKPEQPIYPLGEQPLLLTQITFSEMDTVNAQFILAPEIDDGFQLPFNPSLLASLLKVLAQALKAANWQLEINTILEMPPEVRLQ